MLSSSASCSRAFPCINATFRRITSPAITFRAGLMLLYVVTAPAWAANATTTTLAVTSAGSAVTTVTAGSVVTLMARVMLAGQPVTTGQVEFCDTTAPRCTDIHLLGMSQLTKAGSASMSFRPGVGSFSYEALFIPSGGRSGSASSALPLMVAGTSVSRTATTFASTGSQGNYLFEAKVVATEGLMASPSGSVSFRDTSSNNVAISTATLGPSRAGVTFANPSTPEVSFIPHGIVAADFDGDGIQDFATSNLGDDVVTIELGNGDGTFNAIDTSPPTGSLPWGIVAGDFNGDGKIDLAVANTNSNTITVLLGEGNGHFTAAASPATGNTPLSLATGDFDEDGNQDLAVSNYGDGTVTILLGNGNGTFTVATSIPIAGIAPEGISVGDFNNDGHLDLAVADLAGQVQILLGDGDANFDTGATLRVGDSPESLVAGDFNGDGNTDLAAANGGDSTVTILIGDGKGNFSANSTPPVTNGLSGQIVLADFNKDDIADLAVTNNNELGTVTVLLGKGDGTFSPGILAVTATYPDALAVADFNGDGVPDLAAADSDSSAVTILTTENTRTAMATAVCVTPVGIGTHRIYARYPGSSTTDPSVSRILDLGGVAAKTTTLAISSNSKDVTTVDFGSVVTLTAKVTDPMSKSSARANVTPVHTNDPAISKVGQVNFCDATADQCWHGINEARPRTRYHMSRSR
jgi:hypothetical protein